MSYLILLILSTCSPALPKSQWAMSQLGPLTPLRALPCSLWKWLPQSSSCFPLPSTSPCQLAPLFMSTDLLTFLSTQYSIPWPSTPHLGFDNLRVIRCPSLSKKFDQNTATLICLCYPLPAFTLQQWNSCDRDHLAPIKPKMSALWPFAKEKKNACHFIVTPFFLPSWSLLNRQQLLSSVPYHTFLIFLYWSHSDDS